MKKNLIFSLITLIFILILSFLFWQKNTQNPIEELIINQEQNTNDINTSDWQEYQNDRYSYSFAIPPGYISKAVYEDVVVSLEPNLFGVNLIKDNSSIRVEIEESSLFSGQGNLNERFTKTTQKSGFKLRNFNGIIFFENDNLENSKLFSTIIGDRVLSFKFANVEEDTMKAVLASFKFNQAYSLDTSDWKTYRSEELDIEFKYPKDWEIRRSETSYGANKAEQIYFYTTTTLNNPSEGDKVTKIVLEAFDNIYGKTPVEVIITKTGLSSDALEDAFLGEVILDGKKVSKYTIPGFVPLPGLIFEHEDKVYQMIYNLNNDHFNKVLETFKFIE